MHDPNTQAFTIKIPLPWKTDGFLKTDGRIWAKYHLATIWHKDPERDGSDDSCGWFMRSRHGDPEVLAEIIRRFEHDWDRVFKTSKEDHDDEDGRFQQHTYFCGLFKPNGDPHYSVSGVTLNLFFIATQVVFKSNGLTMWKRSKKFLNRNLLDILLFSENPGDSLFDTITRKFEKGCGEEYGNEARAARIKAMAECIYGWILRAERPWYRHPRWHIHHWRIQVLPLQKFWHWIVDRCSVCGAKFRFNESRYSSWSGESVWHERCDASLRPADKE